MQVAIIYDRDRDCRRFIEFLTKSFGEPTYHNEVDGEVIYRVEDVTQIVNEIIRFLGKLVIVFFVGDDSKDM